MGSAEAECLPPRQMRRLVALSIYHSLHALHPEAKERNEVEAVGTEMIRRETIGGSVRVAGLVGVG